MAKKASIKYETKELVSDEELDELYDGDALTIEGLATKSIPDLLCWIKQYTPLSANCVVYIIKGKTLNHFCGNTGDNAYPDDVNIVCIKLSDIKDFIKIAVPRFTIGGRWFTDVVDNNRRREREKGNK